MNLFVIETMEEFEEIKDAWNRLLEKNSELTAFQTWEFNYYWWKMNSEKGVLHIICFGNKKELHFIAPLYIDERKSLVFLQSGSVDFLDVIYDEAFFAPHIFIKKFSDHLLLSKSFKRAHLTQMRCNSILLHYFPYYFRKTPYYIQQTDLYSFIDKKLFDSTRFLKHVNSKQYKSLKKIDKNIQSCFELIESTKTDFPGQIIEEIIEKMVKRGIREESIYHRQLEYMKKLYECDKIFFIAQKSDKEQYISITCLVRLQNNRVMSWMDLYDPSVKSSNLKNYLHIINFCNAKGADFDMGTGIYPYKIQNFSPETGALFTFFFYKKAHEFVYYFFRKTVAKALGVI